MSGKSKSLWILVLIFILNIYLRSPLFCNAFFDSDIGEAVYSALDLLSGGCIYENTINTKPPLSCFFFATLFLIDRSILIVNIFSILYYSAAIYCIYLLGRKLYGGSAGLWSALLYTMFSADFWSGGLDPNYTTWTILPTVLAYLFAHETIKAGRSKDPLLTGAFAALAVLGKQQAGIVILGIFVYWLLELRGERKRLLSVLLLSTSGVALMISPFFFFFASKECLGWVWEQLGPIKEVGYIKVNLGQLLFSLKKFIGIFFLDNIFCTIAVLAAFVLPSRKSIDRLIRYWFVFAIIAIMLPGLLYGHYFTLLWPPVSLIAAGLLTWIFKLIKKMNTKRAFTLLVLALMMIDYRAELTLAGLAVQGRITEGEVITSKFLEYGQKFPDSPTPPSWQHSIENHHYYLAVGRWIKENSTPKDTILVWEYFPQVYFFADRRSPTRHFEIFDVAADLPLGYGPWHQEGDEKLRQGRQEMMRQLHDNPPKFIVAYITDCPCKENGAPDFENLLWPKDIYGHPMVWCIKPIPMFLELDQFISNNYFLTHEISRIGIWQRID